ncbi:MAG: polysaccharide biosynthesis C-terminal domain-containing protein [Clostridia bacterium]|nr:polysaccharide biosynthesis C-terminal domain-containing protein [Clostridia bacterium]
MIAKVLGLGIAIIVSAMTARCFGAELKGVMSVVENDVTLYSVFIGLGIYQAYPFFRKKEPDILPTYVNNISSLFLLYEAVAVLIASVMIFCRINVFLAIAIMLMPVDAYIKQLNYIVLVEHPRRRNFSSLIISMSEIVLLAVIWIFWNASVTSVLTYYICTVLANLALSYINLRYNPLMVRFSLNRIFEFIKFGWIPMLVYLCMSINYKIDIQMLKQYDHVSMADIGIYGTGVALASKIWLVPDAIKDILLSKLVKNGKGECEVAKVIRISLFVCTLCVLLLALLGKWAILLLYGPEFDLAYYVMLIMLIGVEGMIFYKMVYSYNVSRGKRTINLIFLGLSAVVNVIGNLILIPLYGIIGAAIMSVVSYLVCGICFLVYFHCVSQVPITQILFPQKEDLDMLKGFFQKKK